MIVRIVKMTFVPKNIDAFLKVFNESKEKIRAFEGISYLELLRDKNQPNVLFTHSIWKGEEFLEKYRSSELFKTTWAKTKVLFQEPAEAWTLISEINLN